MNSASDLKGNPQVIKSEAVYTQDDDDLEQPQSNSEDGDEEGVWDGDVYEEYDDSNEIDTNSDGDIVDYLGYPVTKRQAREIGDETTQYLQEYLAELEAENGGYLPPARGGIDYETPSLAPSKTIRPTILPASHFKCSICGTQAVRRVAGENAMPHNRGRGFYKCSNIAHGRYFEWEDGAGSFSEESQARFNDWMDSSIDYDD